MARRSLGPFFDPFLIKLDSQSNRSRPSPTVDFLLSKNPQTDQVSKGFYPWVCTESPSGPDVCRQSRIDIVPAACLKSGGSDEPLKRPKSRSHRGLSP